MTIGLIGLKNLFIGVKMKKNWKPEGYNTASPYLVVTQPQRLIDFLIATFDAEPLHRHETPEGRIAHAEVRIGDSVIMMGDPGDESSAPCHIHVYVENVESTFKRAIAAGGRSVQEPMKKADADKRGGITDPSGETTWWIATKID
jgi:uncharacterized glyoxalase superfamily protein PhnB